MYKIFALPIRLESFDVSLENNKVNLSWVTLSEINNDTSINQGNEHVRIPGHNEENYVSPHQIKKTVPGNSSYASMSNNGRKICIISDSIASRILMKELNSKIKKGHAYRRYHPGATPKQLFHYCTETLANDQPDEVVINVGTNSLRRDDSCTIANDIIDIVSTCRNYGVNCVYVSGITHRPGFEQQIKEFNDILAHKSHLHDYKFILNSNITISHIWKDKLHLNDDGSKILSANFTRAINNKHS